MSDTEQTQSEISLPGMAKKMISGNLLSEAAAREVLTNAMRENRSFFLQAIEQNGSR